ncbi:MAG: DNA methyltransferase [Candidatus Andeanibacterium colombiense]|uniref:Methyltransferase n=1 Tax=Candidatus Andeanibacterium colombiense TaxID=3121345 RepID=A0AAJ6BP33_9SPHN|nr:MAG: DNA methyltransferase [Sphingomonadaceae bacterium]
MAQRNLRTVASRTSNGSRAAGWRGELVENVDRLWNEVRKSGEQRREHLSGNATYFLDDAVHFLSELPPNSIHAVVTDPPYGVIEYDEINQRKMRAGKGGVWRMPPTLDGVRRAPLPRFTVLSDDERSRLHAFFTAVAFGIHRALVPGGHVFTAANPLLSTMEFHAFQSVGLEKRGEVIRLVQTLRGGDRPKGAEREFADVSMMARSCWEPWGIFRKPLDGTAAHNLRKWGTGGLRRVSDSEPFKDVILCSPTRGIEREIAPHPSLKPQRFLRQLVRASLPLGIGIVYDPFAGSGSTLAAAEAVGYRAIGTERDPQFFGMGKSAFDALSKLRVER